jgi:hypothetical protein
MLATYESTVDQRVLTEVYNDLADIITLAMVEDEFIEVLRAMLEAPATAEQSEQMEVFIALCMDYRYLLGHLQ